MRTLSLSIAFETQGHPKSIAPCQNSSDGGVPHPALRGRLGPAGSNFFCSRLPVSGPLSAGSENAGSVNDEVGIEFLRMRINRSVLRAQTGLFVRAA